MKELFDWVKFPICILIVFALLRIMMWGWIKLEAFFDVPGW